MKYPHLILNNPIGTADYINTSRYPGKPKNEEDDVIEIRDYTYQKERLRQNLYSFKSDRDLRKRKRTISLPYKLEYIEIHFLDYFNKDFGVRKDYYEKDFGLKPVSYKSFNKTVLFYIEDEKLFSHFINLIEQFYNSLNDEDPSSQTYSSIILINSFEFLSSEKIKKGVDGRIIISLTDRLVDSKEWNVIKEGFSNYLNEKNIGVSTLSEGVLELSNAQDFVDEIADNFDVIQSIQSIPPVHVTRGAFGTPRFGWDFRTLFNEKLPVVGVIDSGIYEIDPLKPLIVGSTSILDRERGISLSHGTSVASLVAFGKDLISEDDQINSYSNLYSIQVLNRNVDSFSYSKLKYEIIKAHKEFNVRIFNLSVCDECSFEYNADYTEYAKMLDELAYTYDLLIFIAPGNLSEEYRDFVKSELGDDTPLINYPNHFYNEFNNDYSQPTNIGSPAESMNNITVGAIACNNYDNCTDLTNSHTLPSYYSRKFHIDYSQNINGGEFRKGQKNNNIFKPDILMPGGDWESEESKMLVLGRGLNTRDFYIKLAGTSLATPLAANLAAKIITKYPKINMQSVKALILNFAESTNIESLFVNIIDKCKEQKSREVFGCHFNDLSSTDKRKISAKFNSKNLTKHVEGHGVPNEDKCLNSTDKRVTFVIEDQIKTRHYQIKHIKLPEYLLESQKHKVLKVRGTICFKFSPIKDDSMAYNPIHISFKFLNAQEDSQKTAAIVSNKNKEGIPLVSKEERENKLHIKSSNKWSEDFGNFNRRLFSNTQKSEIIINKKDLVTIDNEIAVAVRCLVKEDFIDKDVENPYSMVISIEEYDNLGLEQDLYEEISAINEVENITELDTSLDVEIAD